MNNFRGCFSQKEELSMKNFKRFDLDILVMLYYFERGFFFKFSMKKYEKTKYLFDDYILLIKSINEIKNLVNEIKNIDENDENSIKLRIVLMRNFNAIKKVMEPEERWLKHELFLSWEQNKRDK